MQSIVNHFDYQLARSMDLEAERKKWFIAARDQREKKQLAEDRADDELLELATSTLLATPAEIEAFEVRLDHYDEATVKALLENQEALDAINLEIETMRMEAYRLDDGTLVFKSETGNVFNEHGVQMSPDIIPPEAIPDKNPSWERYNGAVSTRDGLLVEREQLHEYQEKLDSARDAARSGELTKDELDALDQELADTMPPSVAKHLPEDMRPKAPAPAADLKSAFDTVAPDIAPTITKAAPVSPMAPLAPGR